MSALGFLAVITTVTLAVIGAMSIIALALWSFVRDVVKEIR